MDSASCQFFTYVEDKSECMAGTEDALEAIVLVPNHGVGTYIRQPLLEHISDGMQFAQ